MPALLIEFPARRYHATPWGHHVNEGLIEWPPSPWRLLRGLISTGYTSGLWNGDGPPETGRSLFEALASVLPSYRLPSASGTHSRHFMPTDKLDKQGLPNRTLVFDAWARISSGAMAVVWDVNLSREESELLAALAARMNYLGRSESWVSARTMGQDEPLPTGGDCFPSDEPPRPGWEQVSLLAPQSPNAYAEWRESAAKGALSELADKYSGKKKPTKKQRENALAPFPENLIACLEETTAFWRKHGWSQPPGSRRVLYRRRSDALEPGSPILRPSFSSPHPVVAMLLSMATKSGNNHALPPVTRALPQGELFHQSMVGHAHRLGLSCPALTGRDLQGRPLRHGHRHAHAISLDLDGDGHLDHLLVWAPNGLDSNAQKVVRAIRKTYAKKLVEPLRLALVGIGDRESLRKLPGMYGQRLGSIFGPADGAKRWRGITPFVAPRFLKKSGKNALEGQVAAELESRNLPALAEFRLLDPGRDSELLRHRHFVRIRGRGSQPPADFGFSLEICLKEPAQGPICLGYGSHFGLGLFAAT